MAQSDTLDLSGRESHSEETVRIAFEQCFKSEYIDSLYLVVVCGITIFMLYNVVECYRKSAGDKKVWVDLIITYGKYMAFIAAFPFILNFVELSGAYMQDHLKEKFGPTSYNKTVWEILRKQKEEVYKEIYGDPIDKDAGMGERIRDILKTINPVNKAKQLFGELSAEINSFFILLIKKTYFFFVCGRYLWLGMLKIVAPLALVCYLNPNTKSYFFSWVKYMQLNYLMVPFFLFADIFSDNVILVFAEEKYVGALGIFYFIGLFLLKLSMFGIVSKRLNNLL